MADLFVPGGANTAFGHIIAVSGTASSRVTGAAGREARFILSSTTAHRLFVEHSLAPYIGRRLAAVQFYFTNVLTRTSINQIRQYNFGTRPTLATDQQVYDALGSGVSYMAGPIITGPYLSGMFGIGTQPVADLQAALAPG